MSRSTRRAATSGAARSRCPRSAPAPGSGAGGAAGAAARARAAPAARSRAFERSSGPPIRTRARAPPEKRNSRMCWFRIFCEAGSMKFRRSSLITITSIFCHSAQQSAQTFCLDLGAERAGHGRAGEGRRVGPAAAGAVDGRGHQRTSPGSTIRLSERSRTSFGTRTSSTRSLALAAAAAEPLDHLVRHARASRRPAAWRSAGRSR